jgi:hypothetical protein
MSTNSKLSVIIKNPDINQQTLQVYERYGYYYNLKHMKQPFNATLTGTDSPVNGIAKQINLFGSDNTWRFDSIDNSMRLVIAEDDKGNWERISGTEPYLSGWTDELAEQVSKND